MAKVTINGEVFAYDTDKQPLIEALVIERTLKIPFSEYQAQTEADKKNDIYRAEPLAVFAWRVLHRNGRDVSLPDILDGTFDIDMGSITVEGLEDEEAEADPTNQTDGPSSTTAVVTSGSSPSGSGSGPGKSNSST